MGHRFSVLILASLVLTACASGGLGTALPAPTDVTITPPASDLASELAAFSGIWKGIWMSTSGQGLGLQSQLIVEKINATSARVVYIWGDHSYFKAGWNRQNASVLPGGEIQWGRDPHVVFKMSEDRKSITGKWESKGIVSTITMRKIGQQ